MHLIHMVYKFWQSQNLQLNQSEIIKYQQQDTQSVLLFEVVQGLVSFFDILKPHHKFQSQKAKFLANI